MTKYPSHLLTLIEFFKKLPGVGQRSAERYAFQMINWPKESLHNFGEIIKQIPSEVHFCDRCGAMAQAKSCFYCDDSHRSLNQMCIVAATKDIFSIEDSHSYNGLYHVLGSLLSPASGFDAKHLKLDLLINRLQQLKTQEVILAFDSTIEGDATTLFLKKELSNYVREVSRLAFGIPVGSSLEYIDSSTLSRALTGRQGF